MFLILYKSLVRPILEYCSTVWYPILSKHIQQIEKVQRRATKLIPELRSLPYPDRLKKLGLPTLIYRRDREDLIQTYIILSDPTHPLSHLFVLSNDRLRGHAKKLKKCEHYRNRTRQSYFSQRVISPWNALPSNIVMAPNLNTFKTLLNDLDWHSYKFTL